MGEEDKYKENTNFYAIWVRTLLQKINTSTRKTYTIGKTVTSGDGILGSGSPNFYLNVKQILNYNRGYSRYPMLKKLEPWIFFFSNGLGRNYIWRGRAWAKYLKFVPITSQDFLELDYVHYFRFDEQC